jgi:O-antigen/teichoic acid export membrane protein
MQLKKALWGNLVYTAVQFTLPLITMVFLAHVLGASAFGQLSWVEGFCRLLGLLFSMGIPLYGPKALMQCGTDEERTAVLNGLLRIHLFIVLLMLGAGMIFFQGLKWNDFLPWPWIYLLSQVFQLEWFFQGTQRFDFVIKRSLFVRSAALLAVCFFVRRPEDVYLGFMILATVQCVLGVFNVWHLRKEIDFSWKGNVQLPIRIDKTLVWLAISGLCITAYTLLDTVILGWFADTQSVGNYSVSIRITKLPMIVMGSIISMLVLKLIQLTKQGKSKDFEVVLTKSYKLLMLMILPITVLLLSMPDHWARLMGGRTFTSAAEIIKIVAWILPFMVISNVFGFQLMISLNREKQYMNMAFVGLVTALVLYMLLIPNWGSIGAAWATFFTELVVAMMSVILSYRYLKSIHIVNFTIQWVLLLLPIYGIIWWMNTITGGADFLFIIAPLLLLFYCVVAVYFVLKERWVFNFVFPSIGYGKV